MIGAAATHLARLTDDRVAAVKFPLANFAARHVRVCAHALGDIRTQAASAARARFKNSSQRNRRLARSGRRIVLLATAATSAFLRLAARRAVLGLDLRVAPFAWLAVRTFSALTAASIASASSATATAATATCIAG